jgi:hypothetical protein
MEPELVSRQSGRLAVVRAALAQGEWNARLLDGREFDPRYWQNARRQLAALERHLATVEGRLEAFAAVLDARENP